MKMITKIPLEQATPGVKAALAQFILKAAANGQTGSEGFVVVASDELQTMMIGVPALTAAPAVIAQPVVGASFIHRRKPHSRAPPERWSLSCQSLPDYSLKYSVANRAAR